MNQLPVSELFLFNHGMGFLVRSKNWIMGSDIQKAIFKIKSAEINDVLKSLLLNIPNCTVTDINYSTPTKEETRLELEENETLSSFISHNKGLKVTINLHDTNESIEGRLLLVEGEDTESHVPKSLSLLTENGIKSIPVKQVSSLTIHDERLIKEFQKSIFNYTWDKDKEREVIISFKGNSNLKETTVSIGYLIQMPVWKISYRLRLSGDDIRLSGWVIVENETNDDWNQIDLQLISGNPISFIYDQDKLVQLTRSDFTPLPPKASGPVIAQASLESESMDLASATGGGLGAPKMKMAGHMRAMASAPKPAPPPSAGAPPPMQAWFGNTAAEPEKYFDEEKHDGLMDQMIDAVQETEKDIKTGSDYYVFTIKSKITIPTKEKSLIPLINEQIKAKKIFYHKNTIKNPSPFQAIELTNDTDFPFEHGPVMVFDESNPVGQTILEKTNVGQSRILSYALEDRIRIQYKNEITHFSEFTYSFHPERRSLIQRRFQYMKLEIRIINFLVEPSNLIIDYFPDEEVDLINETTPPNVSVVKKEKYFRITLQPTQKSIEKYELQFNKELVTNLYFETLSKQLVLNIPAGNLKDPIKEKLIGFIELQEKNRQINNDINNLRGRMNNLVADEDRLQKNILSLSNRKEDERTRNNFILKLEEIFEEYLRLQDQEIGLKKQENEIKLAMDKLLLEMTNFGLTK